ncbi:MAG: hypothetical protein QOD76_544 [Solirubrobacteraceae bacterium]|jgi:hypothetical protein|nr:hypothetical protein [Solirubrobacteraceae bacterium]
MAGGATLSYDRVAEQVQEMMTKGTPFAQVEDVIDTTPTPQDQKAALWLLAWALRDPAR